MKHIDPQVEAYINSLDEETRNVNTCANCTDNSTCEYAFDAYNTNGDCLAIK